MHSVRHVGRDALNSVAVRREDVKVEQWEAHACRRHGVMRSGRAGLLCSRPSTPIQLLGFSEAGRRRSSDAGPLLAQSHGSSKSAVRPMFMQARCPKLDDERGWRSWQRLANDRRASQRLV